VRQSEFFHLPSQQLSFGEIGVTMCLGASHSAPGQSASLHLIFADPWSKEWGQPQSTVPIASIAAQPGQSQNVLGGGDAVKAATKNVVANGKKQVKHESRPPRQGIPLPLPLAYPSVTAQQSLSGESTFQLARFTHRFILVFANLLFLVT
jgi:hypothetical protein